MPVAALIRDRSSDPCGTWKAPWISRELLRLRQVPFEKNRIYRGIRPRRESNQRVPVPPTGSDTARTPIGLRAAPSLFPALPLTVHPAAINSRPFPSQINSGKICNGGFKVCRIHLRRRFHTVLHRDLCIGAPFAQGCLHHISVK